MPPLVAAALLLVALVIAFAVLSLPNFGRRSAAPVAAKNETPASDQLAGSGNSLVPSDTLTTTRAPALAVSTKPSAVLVPSSANVSAPPSAPSPTASSLPSTTLPAPTGARVSAATAQREGMVPDPNRGPAWPTGFTVYRTTAEILAGRDLSDPEQRALAVAEMSEAEEVRYEAVLAKAEQLGIPVRVDGVGNKSPSFTTSAAKNRSTAPRKTAMRPSPAGLICSIPHLTTSAARE